MILETEENLQSEAKPDQSRFWNLKERAILSALVAFTISFTLIVFGPVSIYANNSAEFQFILSDFIGWNILFAFIIALGVFGILMIFRKRVFDIIYAIFFGATVLFFLQGNYLNFGLHSLGGDTNVDYGIYLVIDIFVWAVLMALCIVGIILLRKEHRDIVKMISIIAAITLVGMQLVSTIALVLDPESFPSREDKMKDGKDVLTYEHLTEVSEQGNILYFLVDRLDWRFCQEAEENNPEIFNSLDGFTLYDDAMSLYPRTYPSVAYMLSGIEYDKKPRKEFLDYTFRNSPHMKHLKESGYNVNIFSDQYFVYEDAACMKEYITNAQKVANYTISNPFGLSMKIVQLSLYRYLPIFIKQFIPVSTADFGNFVRYTEAEHYQLLMPKLYDAIGEDPFTTYSDQKNFSFIHMAGPHTPFDYDENFQPTLNGTPLQATIQSFKIIDRYLNHMKEAGLYRDATIVITADHCALDDEMKAPVRSQTIPIFFKKSGAGSNEQKNEPITRSSAPVCHENIFPEIYQSEGLTAVDNKKSLSEIDSLSDSEKQNVVRKYIYMRQDGKDYDDWKFENIEYKVVGFAKDFSHWEIVNREMVPNIYD